MNNLFAAVTIVILFGMAHHHLLFKVDKIQKSINKHIHHQAT